MALHSQHYFGSLHLTSEQNVKLGVSLVQRDNADLEKIAQWFDDHNTFDINDPSLSSLLIILYAKQADRIIFNEVVLVEASTKALKVCKMRSYHENNVIYIDPSFMFMRLLAIMYQEGYADLRSFQT